MFGSLNLGRFLLATVAVFITTFVYDLIVHGHLLVDTYKDTTMSVGSGTIAMDFSLVIKLLTLMVITFIFTRNYEGKGLGEGVRFGLMIGLLVGLVLVGSHIGLSTISTVGLVWIIDSIIGGIVVGVTLSLVYGHKK